MRAGRRRVGHPHRGPNTRGRRAGGTRRWVPGLVHPCERRVTRVRDRGGDRHPRAPVRPDLGGVDRRMDVDGMGGCRADAARLRRPGEPGSEGGAAVRGREETAKETVAYWGYRTVEWLAMTLPQKSGRRAFEMLGRIAHRSMPNLRATVAANQARGIGTDVDDPRGWPAARAAVGLGARHSVHTL